MARARTAETDLDKPYTENYPPLRDWLRQIGARCDWQVPLGNAKAPVAYVEQWQAPGARSFIVIVHARQHGWNIYTDCGDNSIGATLIDAAARIGLGVTNAADLAAVLETQQVAQGLANGLPPRGEMGRAALARRSRKTAGR